MTPREREAPPVASAVVVDSRWYADMLGTPAVTVEDAAHWPIQAPVMRFGPVRGLALGALSYRAAAVGVIKNTPGVLVALAVAAARPRRSRLVLLEFIRRPLPRRRWKQVVYRARFHLLERPLVRRGMAAGQVLTEIERERYRRLYGVAAHRLRLVPWALSAEGRKPDRSRVPAGRGVLASGRTSCDWETLFAAAAGRSWPLTVVCAPHDLERVRALNRDGRARVLCEVSGAEHRELLRASAVYALVLREERSSAGHGRLRAAVDAGVPIVASRVAALDGYAEDGETALLVPPGDAQALRSAVDGLLEDRQLAVRLCTQASARARRWTYADYFGAVRRLMEEVAVAELVR